MRWLVIGIFLCLSLNSCVNDLEKIKKVTITNNDPDERIRDLELLITDAGYAKVRIYAKLAETYHSPQSITKLKDSLAIYFYDAHGKIETTLTGDYGEYLPNDQLMKIRNRVVLTNINLKQRLETEELVWNQRDSTIFSDRLVTIVSKQGRFYGDGVRSKQDFSSYEFIQPRGKISND